MDWSICLSACIGAFSGMGLAILAFGRPIVVNVTMPKPLVQIVPNKDVKFTEVGE